MSGSQHNPNGRQSQLGSGWSPLQLQMANLLARAPQAHMATDRGVTWHTPTPPPHLYHVPAPSPPDPLQAMKNVGSNSVFRHTATPPELYRHTPTPPDKHLLRHTPSPGDVKAGAPIPPVDLYPHLGPGRGPTNLDKLVRAEELLAYARVGVDLTLGSRANGAAHHAAPSPALSVRDAPTINSLIARAGGRRVDSLLERLVPSPASPHSVIVHSRVAPTPSPPSSNEDSADSNSAGSSKRKRKPERTVRVGARISPVSLENGEAPHNGPEKPPDPIPGTGPAGPGPARTGPVDTGPAGSGPVGPQQDPTPTAPAIATAPGPPPTLPSPMPPVPADCTRRKTRSGSAETIDEIAAMIAAGGTEPTVPPPTVPPLADKLEAVLASPDHAPAPPSPPHVQTTPVTQEEATPVEITVTSVAASVPVTTVPASTNEVDMEKDRLIDTTPVTTTVEGPRGVSAAVVPRRHSARSSHCEATNVPVESPSEAKPALESSAPPAAAASFVEVENQLEKMFAALDDATNAAAAASNSTNTPPPPKRRKSAPARSRKGPRKKESKPHRREKESVKDAYDSGSNASSGRSRGPYIQIRGPRESPVSVCVMNASGGGGGGEEEEVGRRRGAGAGEERRRGLHASTLGLRYDAATRDHTWVCAFCLRPPHADHLGDLFGPYPVDTDHEEYRALDEATRRHHAAAAAGEVWVHAECGVWAPGVVARGARVWGLARAVWAAAAARCRHCARPSAAVACAQRACVQRAHLPCARAHAWTLSEEDFRAFCPLHPPPAAGT